jgi:hypothetical protein
MAQKEALARRAKAEALLEETASHLRETLHGMASELDPFPFFMNSTTIRAVEAEPGGASRGDRGCVVVCRDGELYEYIYTVTVEGFYPEPSRKEELKELELAPQDYIPYAYNAICELTRMILEREGSGPSP